MFGPSNGATTIAPMTAAVLSRARPITATTAARTTSATIGSIELRCIRDACVYLLPAHGGGRPHIGTRVAHTACRRPGEYALERLHQDEKPPSVCEPLVKPIQCFARTPRPEDGEDDCSEAPPLLRPALVAEVAEDLSCFVAQIGGDVGLDDSERQSIRLLPMAWEQPLHTISTSQPALTRCQKASSIEESGMSRIRLIF